MLLYCFFTFATTNKLLACENDSTDKCLFILFVKTYPEDVTHVVKTFPYLRGCQDHLESLVGSRDLDAEKSRERWKVRRKCSGSSVVFQNLRMCTSVLVIKCKPSQDKDYSCLAPRQQRIHPAMSHLGFFVSHPLLAVWSVWEIHIQYIYLSIFGSVLTPLVALMIDFLYG